MADAFICDPVRTPIGRYGGALSTVRADDLAALPIRALLERNEKFESVQVEDVALGCLCPCIHLLRSARRSAQHPGPQ